MSELKVNKITQLAGSTYGVWTAVSAYGTGNSYDFTQYWSNYGGDWAVASFMLDSLGWVHLKGLIRASHDDAAATVFTLPAAYRPADEMDHIFTGWSSDDSGTTVQAVRLNVLDTGAVDVSSPDPHDDDDWVSLDGILFYAGF